MGNTVENGNLQKFLHLMSRQVRSVDEAYATIGEAVEIIADDYHIGQLEYALELFDGPLHRKTINESRILFRCKGKELNDYEYSEDRIFDTGDEGMVTVLVCPYEGYDGWQGDELEMIETVCWQVFSFVEYVRLKDVFAATKLRDLRMGVCNLEGWMQYAAGLIKKGSIENYTAFFFNICNFKYVNKLLPYTHGDEVMYRYSNMVSRALTGRELVARLGGDNFVALVLEDNVEYFKDYIQHVNIKHEFNGKVLEFCFRAYVGIAELNNLHNPGEIMMRISMAYQAARRSGEKVKYFGREMYEESMRQQEIMQRFGKAIAGHEFAVFYQPKVNIVTQRVSGAEAMAIWQGGDDAILPNEFIPVLEKEGRICELNFYVLDEVCAFIRREADAGHTPVRVTVNFSHRNLDDDKLAENIYGIVQKHGIDPAYVEIELSESEDYHEYMIISKLEEKLRSYGIGFSIKDFGNGFSSLNTLKKASFDMLNIDMSFVPMDGDYPEKEKDLVMYRHIVQMANELGMGTIAKGVEKERQLQCMKEADCDMVRGYVYENPMPKNAFAARLNMQNCPE